jgi:hypothetical protein
MQKAHSLTPQETGMMQSLEDERRNLLAQFGGLTYELEGVRQQIPQLDQRRRLFVERVALRAGVTQFRTARIEGNNLIVDVEEAEPAPPAPMLVERVNGKAAEETR